MKKSLLKSGLVLSLMTLFSRIMGLIREGTKAHFMGTSSYADAFTIAFMIPNLFRRLFAENAISVAFIPTFRGYLEEEQNDENKFKIQKFISSTLTLVSFLTAVVTVIGIIVTPFIIPFFLGDAQNGVIGEGTFLTRLMFPYLIVISVAAFFQGILNGVRVFAPSGFTPVIFNFCVIVFTFALTPFLPNPQGLPKEAMAARAMAIGVLCGGCFQAIFQWPFVRKVGWKTTLTGLKAAFTNPGTRRVCALIVPTIIGMAAYQLNDVVSTAIAGNIGPGTVSSLQYSLRLQELILGIFAVSIGTVILPDLSSLAKKENWQEFNDMLLQAIKIIALITIPVTFYSLVSGQELISLVYKRGSFDDESLHSTLEVFRFHIAGLYFIAVNRIISPAFYAQGNTKLPTAAGIISFVVNIGFAFLFSLPLSGGGIALALTAASLVNTVFLFVFMRKMNGMNAKQIAFKMIAFILKMMVFSVIAAVPAYFVRLFLVDCFGKYNWLVAYGVPVLATAFVFGAVGILLLVLSKDSVSVALLAKVKGKVRRS